MRHVLVWDIEAMPDLAGFAETEFTMNTYVAIIGGLY